MKDGKSENSPPRTAVDLLTPGMIVTADVCSPEGRLLLAKGKVIKIEHLRIFKAWGIIDVMIGETVPREPEAEAGKEDQASLELTEKLADEVFIEARKENRFDRILRNIFLTSTLAEIKETSTETVKNRIRRQLIRCQRLSNQEFPQIAINDILSGETHLPALSSTVTRILESIENASSARAIAQILARDVGLSAKILRIVNSSFYGFPNKIDDLSRAITIIGNQQLQTIALGISVVDTLNTGFGESLDLKDFWRHSFFCAILSKCLGEFAVTGTEERLFLGGLLHDIGRLVMLRAQPKMVGAAIDMAQQQSIPLYQAEQKLWGWDHAMLAGELCRIWNFPTAITESISSHHCTNGNHLESDIVNIADSITHACTIGNSGLCQVPPANPDTWKTLALTENRVGTLIQEASIQEKLLLNILL